MHFTGTTVLRLQDGKIAEEIGLDDGGPRSSSLVSCALPEQKMRPLPVLSGSRIRPTMFT